MKGRPLLLYTADEFDMDDQYDLFMTLNTSARNVIGVLPQLNS